MSALAEQYSSWSCEGKAGHSADVTSLGSNLKPTKYFFNIEAVR